MVGAGENSRQIREALGVELDRRQGELAGINAAIGRGQGHLRRVANGSRPITLDLLLVALEAMDLDAGRFLANALGARIDNDSLLEEIEGRGGIDRRLQRIEKVTGELEVSTATDSEPPAADVEALVAAMVSCSGTEQRRRLGKARKYRHPAFATAYLEHLDALRYDDPKQARQNAEAAAMKLIPRLPGSRSRRIELQLKAMGVFASCHRQQGRWATAARALRVALGVARRHGLSGITGDLLQRAACILSDNGRFEEANSLLDEALVIYYDLDWEEEQGMVMVERGTALLSLGRYTDAITVLERSLNLLSRNSLRTRRNRLAAHQRIAFAHRELGALEQAEASLAQAIKESEGAGRLTRASLLWDYGTITLKRRSYEDAEKRLRTAADLFDQLKHPTKALIVLDLTHALLGQRKNLEAAATAMGMAKYLTAFRGNKVAEATISELVQLAVRGELSMSVVRQTSTQLGLAGKTLSP